MPRSKSTDSGSGLSKVLNFGPYGQPRVVATSVDHNTPSSVAPCNTGEDVDDSKSQHSLST